MNPNNARFGKKIGNAEEIAEVLGLPLEKTRFILDALERNGSIYKRPTEERNVYKYQTPTRPELYKNEMVFDYQPTPRQLKELMKAYHLTDDRVAFLGGYQSKRILFNYLNGTGKMPASVWFLLVCTCVLEKEAFQNIKKIAETIFTDEDHEDIGYIEQE